MVIISGAYGKLKRWVKARIATHKADSSAHHTKYLDSEAVTAVSNADNYIKNTGDTITGSLVSTKTGVGGGWDVQDEYNVFRIKNGGTYAGWYLKEYDGTTLGWFGGRKNAANKGELAYYLYLNGGAGRELLVVHYDYVYIERPLYLAHYKTGATQAAAGAAAAEVWVTSGHATLPDRVLMIGA